MLSFFKSVKESAPLEEAGKFILIKDNPMTDNVKRFGVAVAELKRLKRVLIDREGVDF
jgi:hypothetical protein